MQIKLLHSGRNYEVKEVGSFNPKPYPREKLQTGETGYLTANIKSPSEVKMGDTITDARHPSPMLPGSKKFIRWCSAEFIPSIPRITSI